MKIAEKKYVLSFVVETNNPIVFYDGECGFCNRTVAFVLKNDRSKRIHFTAIQSEHTASLFKEKGWTEPDLSTFYLVENGQLFSRSTAALKLTKYFRFPSALLVVFWIVPRFFRDWVYSGIAKRRQRIAKGYCVVPTNEQQKRFIK